MGLILKQLFNFLKLLNSETGTNQIAAGLCCGLIIGFAPAFSLQTLFVIFLTLIFRIQIGAVFVSSFFFAFVAFAFDPIFHQVGTVVLTNESLNPLFTTMYNMPIVPLTNFNNTIVMGSAVIALALFLPMFFVFRILIIKYRQTVVERFKSSKAWNAIQATSLYKWYYKYDQLYG